MIYYRGGFPGRCFCGTDIEAIDTTDEDSNLRTEPVSIALPLAKPAPHVGKNGLGGSILDVGDRQDPLCSSGRNPI
jgi:hypothetical protein